MTDRKPPSAATVRQARKWLRALRLEAVARADYLQADEPRARKRARQRWLDAQHAHALMKMPSDEALRAAKEKH